MRLIFSIVVSVITIILMGAHYGFYKLTVVILELGGTSFADRYFGIVMFLGLSFTLSNLLVFSRDNLLTRVYYTLSAIWTGSFFYVLLAALTAGLLTILLPLTGLPGLNPAGALVVITLAVPVLLFAYRNAMMPRVKRIGVRIRHLPDSWRRRRVVFVSDLHIGAILRRGFLRRVVNRIKQVDPDLVLIGGDLFDGGGANMASLITPIDEIKAELGVFMITGNHETYIHQESALNAINSTQIRLLQNKVVELEGLQLVGIDYPSPGNKDDPEEVLRQLDSDMPTILLYHEPRKTDLFKKYGVNLHLAGHTHRGQIWPFNYITKLVYKGLDYGLHTDGDFNLYCSCGVGTWGPPFRTASRSEIVVVELA